MCESFQYNKRGWDFRKIEPIHVYISFQVFQNLKQRLKEVIGLTLIKQTLTIATWPSLINSFNMASCIYSHVNPVSFIFPTSMFEILSA